MITPGIIFLCLLPGGSTSGCEETRTATSAPSACDIDEHRRRFVRVSRRKCACRLKLGARVEYLYTRYRPDAVIADCGCGRGSSIRFTHTHLRRAGLNYKFDLARTRPGVFFFFCVSFCCLGVVLFLCLLVGRPPC